MNSQLTKASLETGSHTIVTRAHGRADRGRRVAGRMRACVVHGRVPAARCRLRNQDQEAAPAFTAVYSSPVPSVDGLVLPQSIRATFTAGQNNAVPVINGRTRTSGRCSSRSASRPAHHRSPPRAIRPIRDRPGPRCARRQHRRRLSLANYGTNAAQQPSLAATAVGTDLIFACNALNVSSGCRRRARRSGCTSSATRPRSRRSARTRPRAHTASASRRAPRTRTNCSTCSTSAAIRRARPSSRRCRTRCRPTGRTSRAAATRTWAARCRT